MTEPQAPDGIVDWLKTGIDTFTDLTAQGHATAFLWVTSDGRRERPQTAAGLPAATASSGARPGGGAARASTA